MRKCRSQYYLWTKNHAWCLNFRSKICSIEIHGAFTTLLNHQRIKINSVREKKFNLRLFCFSFLLTKFIQTLLCFEKQLKSENVEDLEAKAENLCIRAYEWEGGAIRMRI